jgi:hypothetical protein
MGDSNLRLVSAAATKEQALPSPVPLMQLSTGFWAFKALAAAHELGLFAHISRIGSETVEGLSQTFEIDPRPAEMLLTGCASLGLIEKRDGRYRNAPASEAYLVPGKPHYFGGWIEMADKRLYAGWGKLTEALRSNRPTTWNPDVQASLFDGVDPKMLALFWEAMHSLSIMTARALGAAFDFGPYRRLLDIGGGSGAFDIELCRQYPDLRASVFDLPHVAAIAAGKVAQAGMSGRIGTIGGTFFGDFPKGYDVHLFSMIMHDWDEAKNKALLRQSYNALPTGGAVVISELLVDDDKSGPASAALMSLNMLIETEGRNYTAAEYAAWLREIGFRDINTVRFDAPGANGAVIGFKR